MTKREKKRHAKQSGRKFDPSEVVTYIAPGVYLDKKGKRHFVNRIGGKLPHGRYGGSGLFTYFLNIVDATLGPESTTRYRMVTLREHVENFAVLEHNGVDAKAYQENAKRALESEDTTFFVEVSPPVAPYVTPVISFEPTGGIDIGFFKDLNVQEQINQGIETGDQSQINFFSKLLAELGGVQTTPLCLIASGHRREERSIAFLVLHEDKMMDKDYITEQAHYAINESWPKNTEPFYDILKVTEVKG